MELKEAARFPLVCYGASLLLRTGARVFYFLKLFVLHFSVLLEFCNSVKIYKI